MHHSGLIADLAAAFLGSQHGTTIWDCSGLQEVLEHDSKGYKGRQMMLYGHQGYCLSQVLMTPYPGLDLQDDEASFNQKMSSACIAVEREFGRVHNMTRMTQ